MSFPNTTAILFNGLTLALALGFLLIVLWQDTRKQLNQFFAFFLFLVALWNAGALLAQGIALVDRVSPLIAFAVSIMEVGFTGSSVAVYVLTATQVGIQNRRFQLLAFASLLVVLGYQLFLIVNRTQLPIEITHDGGVIYRLQPLSSVFYITFDGTTLYLTWRYRRKIRSHTLLLGIALFALSQSLGFLNPELRGLSISATASSAAALVISFAILQQQIITPLAERITQVEAMHKVSLAITSQIALDTVLSQIATQAARWLDADGAGIFLTNNTGLELATVYNLPKQLIHTHIQTGEGIAGIVAETHQSIHLNNYRENWSGSPDLPLAEETFGSVICVPLIYGGEAIGTLMVIAGLQGRTFQREHVHLLELLGAQAAVAIAHSRLFAEQDTLTRQVEAARIQLETVLISTENPVIAVDRKFRLIFANPAARMLFSVQENTKGTSINEILPPIALPPDNRQALRDLRRNRVHIYEISLGEKVFLCHLARLGRPRTAGWVAVLNDITQLKELDRLKSEMVRMTSHDLKNPLQAAMANLELLNDDLTETGITETQETIAIIQKQLERMNRIIGGILDLERIKTGIPTLELCSPRKLIEHTIEELQHLANDLKIDLVAHFEPNETKFLGDPEQFQRALTNLVENAIKFTPSGGNVTIKTKNQTETNSIIFQIQDTGIGIPRPLQSQIFDRFFRGGPKGQQGAEHISGSGLGLSLVKTIVENHHGKVWLESEVGKGTSFFVNLPIADEPTHNRT